MLEFPLEFYGFSLFVWSKAYEKRGDVVEDVDCFTGSSLFGFGVVGWWHFEW